MYYNWFKYWLNKVLNIHMFPRTGQYFVDSDLILRTDNDSDAHLIGSCRVENIALIVRKDDLEK